MINRKMRTFPNSVMSNNSKIYRMLKEDKVLTKRTFLFDVITEGASSFSPAAAPAEMLLSDLS